MRADGGGLRYDSFKVRVDLIRPLMIWALAVVFTRGGLKYASNNWMRGMKWSKVAGPMKRHTEKWRAGEVYDQETGCHHLAMVAWNALVLLYYQIMKLGTNDLEVFHDVQFRTGDDPQEIDSFDHVNNKPIEVYVREVAELKAEKNGTTVEEELKAIMENA